MSEKEKAVVASIAKAFDKLPAEKQQYFLGYAEGIADISAGRKEAENAKDKV